MSLTLIEPAPQSVKELNEDSVADSLLRHPRQPTPGRQNAGGRIYESSRPIWIILAITLLIAGCFVAMGLQQRQSRRETEAVPISQTRLGDRVPGENPEGDSGEPEIEASQWRAVYIQATLEDGSLLELDLLRPVAWVRQHDLKVGHEVPVNFGETETKRGLGKVQRINPCPPLRAGPGHTVTGVFRHAVPEIVVVSTTNGEQIRATPEHPFWSETHSAFVPAKDLEPGSRLRHLTGETTVASVSARPAQQTVYNLEVHSSHAFHVGESGLLVHNCGTRFIAKVDGTVVDLKPTLDRIANGGSFPHRNDGTIFKNKEGLLPAQPVGHYREYVHPTPGVNGPGAQRIVVGANGEMFFTPDHYKTFIPIPQ